MSEENEGEEDKQKDDFSVSDEFDFYFPFTKPLVLDLPTEEDRVLASAWVQKLEAEPEADENKRERLNYLKLLLFALQRGRLSGIFKEQPPSGPLDPFPQGFSIFDMANWMLEQDDTPACGGGDAGHVPYIIEISNDLREYVASQEVPNFGVQMYYAWSSDEAIDKWSFFDEEKFPQYILDKIKQLQEIKSDEKSSIVKNGCLIKKKGCNLSIPEKYSQKKVKSPQEIERSQGRSFHTYMGLVGRLGNFNDKCDDDPKKFQRQDQRKGKGLRRGDQKKCPGSRGEAEEEEEEFDNPVPNLGGLDSINRPCLCPYPCHHPVCPDHYTKGEPQPNSYEDQQTSDRNFAFNIRSDPENPHWTATVTKNPGPRRMREQCLENEMPSQKRSISPRPRSSSPNHPNLECTSEGICMCSSSRCPCPCPRMSQKMSVHKIPSASRTGGRGGVDLNRTFTKSPKQEQSFNENRGIGSYLTSFNAPDTCTPSPRRPDITPTGGRTNTSSSLRPVQPDIVHCYDNQNPDPALTKRMDTNTEWLQTIGGGNRYMNTDLKIACRRDQLIAAAQQNKCKVASRRELFSSQQQSSASPLLSSPCPPTSGTAKRSPPLESHPLCEYSPPEEASGPCPSGQQRIYPQQNYSECEGSASPQTYCGLHETYGKQITDTYKKTVPQTTSRLKSASTYYLSNPFAVRNDTGRLSNMTSVLQGIKQKTETHREKCAQMRSPVNDIRPETRVCHSPQPPDANLCSPGPLDRAYIDLPMPPEHCPLPGSPYPGYFSNRVVNYQQDECDFEYEEEDECESSESVEACPQEAPNEWDDWKSQQTKEFKEALSRRCQEYYTITFLDESNDCEQFENSPHQVLRENIQSCKQQEFNSRDDSENYSKTLTSGSYGVSFTENDQCYDPKRTHRRTFMNVSSRDCGHQRTSPERTLVPESCVTEGSFGRTSRSQWASSRVLSNEVCINEELPERYGAYQERDMRNCRLQTPNQSAPGNRYFIESAKSSRSGQTYQPVTSTPLQHYDRNFKDQGTDDLTAVRPPSGRCA